MVGMAEVEVDKETGKVDLIEYAAVVDCGTVVNPNLARIQTEGGIAQGIGMALYELSLIHISLDVIPSGGLSMYFLRNSSILDFMVVFLL